MGMWKPCLFVKDSCRISIPVLHVLHTAASEIDLAIDCTCRKRNPDKMPSSSASASPEASSSKSANIFRLLAKETSFTVFSSLESSPEVLSFSSLCLSFSNIAIFLRFRGIFFFFSALPAYSRILQLRFHENGSHEPISSFMMTSFPVNRRTTNLLLRLGPELRKRKRAAGKSLPPCYRGRLGLRVDTKHNQITQRIGVFRISKTRVILNRF